MIRLLYILSAVLFLSANAFLNLGIHYCGGRIADTAILHGDHSLGCGMEEEDGVKCENEKLLFSYDLMIKQRECCQDSHISLQISEIFNFSFLTQAFASVPLAEVPSSVIFYNEIHVLKAFIPESPPPLIQKDIPVLFQTFLI